MNDGDLSLRCPIGLELFIDPVIGADGHTYERKNITTWLRTHKTSPVTREPMDISSLRPNRLVQKLVNEFIAASKEKQYRFHLDSDVQPCEQLLTSVSFGKIIYKAKWTERQGPPVILMKIIGARVCQEASFYAELSCHPHIVRTFGLVYSDPTSTILVQEFTSYNDLSYQLCEREFRPSAEVFLEIFSQIVDALLCLAEKGIVHGDVACRNVLGFRLHPTEPKHNLFKITGYGFTKASTIFSEVADANDTIFAFKPIRSCAPEILKKKHFHLNYSEKSDVYSMGVLIWEACSYGQLPFASIENDTEVRRARRAGQSLEKPSSCDPWLWYIVETCWNFDPSERPTFKELKEHFLKIRCNDVAFDTNDSSMAQSNNVIICEDDIQLIVPRNETSSNVNNHSLTISAEHSNSVNRSLQSLIMVACVYCQIDYPAEELDAHEEVCGSDYITMNTTIDSSIRSRSPRAQVTSYEEEGGESSIHSGISTQHERDGQLNRVDSDLLPMFEMIAENLEQFVFTTVPEGLNYIQCRVTRRKGDIYMLHVEHPVDKKPLSILMAHKESWSMFLHYTITTNDPNKSHGGRPVGSLQVKSLVGTDFIVYGQQHYNQNHRTKDEHQEEIAAVHYDTNILGFKGPRKLTVILPKIQENNQRVKSAPRNRSDNLVERWKHHDMEGLLELHNKSATYYSETESYALNFHDHRVTQASIKNFQLIHNNDPNYICLQVGRAAKNVFICDFRYPLCAVQAFGIALSAFGNKLACE